MAHDVEPSMAIVALRASAIAILIIALGLLVNVLEHGRG